MNRMKQMCCCRDAYAPACYWLDLLDWAYQTSLPYRLDLLQEAYLLQERVLRSSATSADHTWQCQPLQSQSALSTMSEQDSTVPSRDASQHSQILLPLTIQPAGHRLQLPNLENAPVAGAPDAPVGAHGFGRGAVLGAADAELVEGGAADVAVPEAGPMPMFPNRDAKGLEAWFAVGVVS